MIGIGDGFYRFARVTFAENAGQLAYLASYTPDDIQPTDAVQFDQVTFVNNTGLDHLLYKRNPSDHWHFNDCEYDDNTYCGSQATHFREVYTPVYRTPKAADWGTITLRIMLASARRKLAPTQPLATLTVSVAPTNTGARLTLANRL
jgi:hypothetical protein